VIDNCSTVAIDTHTKYGTWGTCKILKSNSVILHSRADDVIPFADSGEIVANSGLPPDTLIDVGSDHRLADPESLKVMLWACNLLGAEEKLPWQDDGPQSPTDRSGDRIATSQEEAGCHAFMISQLRRSHDGRCRSQTLRNIVSCVIGLFRFSRRVALRSASARSGENR